MMYYALIDENNNNHVLENLEDKYPIFKKVKLGDCYKYDGAIAQPFYISFDRIHLIIISFQKPVRLKSI